MTIGRDGHVWFGSYNNRSYYKINGNTGAIISGPHSTLANTPYG